MIGYVIFIMMIVLPGFLILKLGFLKGNRSLVENLALSLGLSICVVLLGLTVVGTLGRGLSAAFALVTVAVSGVGLAGIYMYRRERLVSFRPSRADIPALTLTACQVVLILLQFTKYPIFPKTYSVDFSRHLMMSLDLRDGRMLPVQGTYPTGVALLVAEGVTLLGQEPLVAMQHVMGILASLSPLIIFLAAKKLFKNDYLALISEGVYVSTGVVWYIALFNSGLFANFLAILTSLTTLYLLLDSFDTPSHMSKILIFVAGVSLYLSHYTAVVMVFSFLLYSILMALVNRSHLHLYPLTAALPILPGVFVALLKPDALAYFLSIPSFAGSAAGLVYPFPAADFLAAVSPFLQYLFAVMYSPTLFIFSIIGLPFAAYAAWKSQSKAWAIFPLIWFALIWVTTPHEPIAWRFSYAALLPLTFIIPLEIKGIFSPLWNLRFRRTIRRKRKGKTTVTARPYRIGQIAAVALVSFLLIYSSWLYFMVVDVTTNTTTYSGWQKDVYDSMKWVETHTDAKSRFIALTDWRYTFLDVVSNRNVTLNYFLTPDQALSFSKSNGYDHVILTLSIPMALEFPPPDLPDLYANSSDFKLVYENPDVQIFQVRPS